MNALARLSNPLPISQREMDESFLLEFHRRARRSSWHAILEWLGEKQLADDALSGALDNPDWNK